MYWGYETKSANVAAQASDTCPRCQKATSHAIRVEWEVVHLYFYLRRVRWERWFARCLSCGDEHQLEHSAVGTAKRLPTADPIPLFDRYGWLMVFGAVALFVAFLYFFDAVWSWFGKDA